MVINTKEEKSKKKNKIFTPAFKRNWLLFR